MATMPIKNWETPVSQTPEQHIGNLYIKKRVLEKGKYLEMDAFGYTDAMFLEDTTITVLREGDGNDTEGLWMSDTPNEYYSMWEMVARVKPPRVLVGGLGLGLLVHLLALRSDITEIIVVEKNPDIIAMVSKYLPEKKVRVINSDFMVYVRSQEQAVAFDTVIADIWKGQSGDFEGIVIDCKMMMDEVFPEATKLYWLFQKNFEEEQLQLEKLNGNIFKRVL